MISEVEVLARELISKYLNECDPKNAQDFAILMMKLLSCCGVAMCAAVGYDEAIVRILGTADFLSEYRNVVESEKSKNEKTKVLI